jgi:predicted GTPase
VTLIDIGGMTLNAKRKMQQKMKKCSPQIDSPQKITGSTYNCIDTGGFFIVGFKGKTLKIMDGDKNGKADDD